MTSGNGWLRSRFALVLLGVLGVRSAAAAPPTQSLSPRETAHVRPALWSYSIGVWNPLSVTVAPKLELQSHPLWFLVAPNGLVRVPHKDFVVSPGQWGITGEYGLSVPTVAMRLARGTLFPAWLHEEGRIGWYLVPRAGVVASRTLSHAHVLTGRLDLTVGLPLGHSDARPLDAPQPLDLLFAPVLNRYRSRAGVLYDHLVTPSVRLRGYGDVYVHGREAEFRLPRGFENVTTRLGAGADIGFGASLHRRLTFGVAWWNSDQYAIDTETFERVRSNDIWPTLDFIWEG